MLPQRRSQFVVALGFFILSAAVAVWWWRFERTPLVQVQLPTVAPYDIVMPAADALPEAIFERLELPQTHRVDRGETLVGLLEKAGLERQQANRATFAALEHMDPRSLRAGTEFSVYRSGNDQVTKVVFPVGREGEVLIRRSPRNAEEGDQWESEWRKYRVEEREQTIAGRIETDLSTAMQAAGAPYSLSTALADVLQWDLDFNRDLRRGDEFSVIYKGRWVNGRFEQVAGISAAVYENRGRILEAYRYGEENGYYDGSGRPLRKQFLKSPLPFTRVTDRFSMNRFHPILKVNRPHYGVDYGAPKGTPVRTTGSGSVTFRGRNGGAGNMVTVRHPNGYQTSFLHLSKFHENACKGCRVSQGDLIGYVGSTGLSTGPHLDYRVKRNGRWLDPLKLRSEPAPTLAGDRLRNFLAFRDGQRAQLEWTPAAILESQEETFTAP